MKEEVPERDITIGHNDLESFKGICNEAVFMNLPGNAVLTVYSHAQIERMTVHLHLALASYVQHVVQTNRDTETEFLQ